MLDDRSITKAELAARDLYKTTDSIIINLINKAKILEAKYGNLLRPPYAGYYLFGKTEPAILEEDYYYSQKSYMFGDRTPLTCLPTDDAVVNKNGTIVIPKKYILNAKTLISTKPFLPIIAIDIIAFSLSNVMSIYTHTDNLNTGNRVLKLLHPDITSEQTDEILMFIERLIEDEHNTLYDFINGDEWHIYFCTRLNEVSLIVEKTIDYRILGYYRLQDQLHPPVIE